MELKDIFKEHTDAVESRLKELGADTGELKARLDDLEQKSSRSRGHGDSGPVTWGHTFTESKAAELSALASERGRVSMEMKTTLSSATTAAAGSVGDLIVPQRDGRVVGMAKRRLTIRNLLDVRRATSSSIEYVKQTGAATGAGMVAEGVLKPESDLQFDLASTPMRVIAHWTKASRQVLEDIPQLEGIIDAELRYGLALKEESQLLNGDGTGQNLNGMVPQATAYAAPVVISDLNKIDVIGLAILQSALTNVQPDGVVIHPADWWEMRLLKDSAGNYIIGNPQADVAPTLFGLPVVPTEAIGVKKFLVGPYSEQTLWDRWSARVEVATTNEDDFVKNLVTVLGEERVGFAARRPASMIYGDFDAALAA